jgi:hypothetical protein
VRIEYLLEYASNQKEDNAYVVFPTGFCMEVHEYEYTVSHEENAYTGTVLADSSHEAESRALRQNGFRYPNSEAFVELEKGEGMTIDEAEDRLEE